jgi:hypothetical protein
MEQRCAIRDITVLTAKINDEFAILINGSRRMMLRDKDGRIQISAELLNRLLALHQEIRRF